jgi:hypothetical protein
MLVFAATAVAMGISCSSDSDFERSVSGAVEATLTAVADGNQPIPGPIPRPLPTTVIDDRSSAPTIFSLPPTATPLPDPRVTAFTSFNHFYQLTGIGNRYNRFTDAVYDQYRFSYELESRLEGKETSKAGFEMLVGQYPPFVKDWQGPFRRKVWQLFEAVDRSFRLDETVEPITAIAYPSSFEEASFWNPLLSVVAEWKYGSLGSTSLPEWADNWRRNPYDGVTAYPLWILERFGIEICPTSKYDAPGSNC